MVDVTKIYCAPDLHTHGDILGNDNHFAQKYMVTLVRTENAFEIGIAGCPEDVNNAYKEMSNWRMYV